VPAVSERTVSPYNATKQNWVLAISAWARRHLLIPPAFPITITFRWYEKARRRDPDNVCAGGRKLILDGLVTAGILPGDGPNVICGFTDEFVYQHGEGVAVFLILPDLNELLAAREVGARRSAARRRRG
jgi:hypothetical protein